MKTSVCFRHRGVTRRLIAVTESKAGVYLCTFHPGGESHSSYHTDGRRHFKANGKLLGAPEQRTPIHDITGVELIAELSMWMSFPASTDDAPYEGDQGTEAVLMLHDQVAADEQQFFKLEVWILDRESEGHFYDVFCGIRDEGQVRVAELVTTLDNFPGHKIALCLSTRSPQAAESRCFSTEYLGN